MLARQPCVRMEGVCIKHDDEHEAILPGHVQFMRVPVADLQYGCDGLEDSPRNNARKLSVAVTERSDRIVEGAQLGRSASGRPPLDCRTRVLAGVLEGLSPPLRCAGLRNALAASAHSQIPFEDERRA